MVIRCYLIVVGKDQMEKYGEDGYDVMPYKWCKRLRRRHWFKFIEYICRKTNENKLTKKTIQDSTRNPLKTARRA